jgi:hypothetical protein
MNSKLKKVASQPSWVLRGKDVELAITELGGHMAPVTFYRNTPKSIQPYYVCPWAAEGLKIDDPVLVPLRGDFFCMPFGAPSTYQGKSHVCHGESATKKWKLLDAGKSHGFSALHLTMETAHIPGRITKSVYLVDGQNVVYDQHLLEGYNLSTSVGHHATLAIPQQYGSVHIATSPMLLRQTNPTVVGDPKIGHYQSLALGKEFKDLSRVPLIWNEPALGDCASLPQREGFTDLLGLFNKPSKTPAWTTVTYPEEGFLWFALKDTAHLPATLMWISNRGRHSLPWLGRNRCLGMEDVCGYFAEGLADSVRPNALNKRGIATAIKLSPKTPTTINYIQGVVKVSRGFTKVKTAAFEPGKVTFTAADGKNAAAEVHWDFLKTGNVV